MNDVASVPDDVGDIRRVLFLSHSHAFRAFRIGSHHYAREFARRGVEVIHLSTPISRIHRLLGRVSRSEEAAVPKRTHLDDDGVMHLVPRTLLPIPYGRFSVIKALKRHDIRPEFDAVLLDQPLLWDASVRDLAPRLVYRPTDLYPSGIKNRMQHSIRSAVDGVVATSAEVLRDLGEVGQPKVVIGNGVDAAHVASPDGSDESRPAVCVYVGALDARLDWQQLAAWATERPDVRFVVAGPSATTPAGMPQNLELIGPVPYSGLPTLLRGARVGLLPLSDDPLNAGRSPMKLFEYLAAGLAVVARETPVIRSEADAGLFTYTSSADAAAALDRALAHPSPNAAGVRRASHETWEQKADELMRFLQRLLSV